MATVTLNINPPSPGTQPYTGEALVSGTTVTKVEFWVDGALFRTELYAPYDLFSSGSTGTFGNGTHTIKARAYNESVLVGQDTKTVVEGTASDPRVTAKQKLMALGLTSAEADVTVNAP